MPFFSSQPQSDRMNFSGLFGAGGTKRRLSPDRLPTEPSKKLRLDDTRDMFADDDDEDPAPPAGNDDDTKENSHKKEDEWKEIEGRLKAQPMAEQQNKLDVYELGLEDDDQATGLMPLSATGGSHYRFASKGQRLEHKMATGTANENYQKIDLKKKNFVRGKKTMTGVFVSHSSCFLLLSIMHDSVFRC